MTTRPLSHAASRVREGQASRTPATSVGQGVAISNGIRNSATRDVLLSGVAATPRSAVGGSGASGDVLHLEHDPAMSSTKGDAQSTLVRCDYGYAVASTASYNEHNGTQL